MKKEVFQNLSVFLLVAFSFSCQSTEKNKQEQVVPAVTEEAPNELPWLPITQMDGSQVMVRDLKGKVMLVLFQPDCDHCQREAVQIREHLDQFEEYELYFISDAALPQIAQFAKEYELEGNPNVHFAHATVQDIVNAVGPIQSPSVFLYSGERRLIKSFIGETPIEVILGYL